MKRRSIQAAPALVVFLLRCHLRDSQILDPFIGNYLLYLPRICSLVGFNVSERLEHASDHTLSISAVNITTTMTELNTTDTLGINSTISIDPASRLPPELLVHCISREHGLDLNDIVRASHVSRHWRSIALAEPTLWTKLFVSKQPGLPLAFNSELLARSGAASLDVTMVIFFEHIPWDPNDFALVSSGVSHFWHRIECLELYFTGEYDGHEGLLYQGRFDFLRTSAPILKILKIKDRTYANTGFGGFSVGDDLYWRVTDDLLGGGGALERFDVEGTMLQLPKHCPALSTVTSFDGRLHAESSIPKYLPLLCPKLHYLKLLDLGVSQPFTAGDFRRVKELRLDFRGTPEECDLASQFRHLILREPIAAVIVTSTCWTPGNIEFLTRNRTIQRIKMYNLPVFAGQTGVDHSTLPGYASYRNWDKDQTLMVTNAVAVYKSLSMQTILALGPAYHNIRELSLGLDLLLPFLETSPIMTALDEVTVSIPAGQYDAEWHDGRFIVGPRRLLVHLGLDQHRQARSSLLPSTFAVAPSDVWRAAFDWRDIASKLPGLRRVKIRTKQYLQRDSKIAGRHTYVCAAEVKALVELGLGRQSCEPRTLARLAITGIHFVDGEADTLLNLAELAQELVFDQTAYEVASPLPTAVPADAII